MVPGRSQCDSLILTVVASFLGNRPTVATLEHSEENQEPVHISILPRDGFPLSPAGVDVERPRRGRYFLPRIINNIVLFMSSDSVRVGVVLDCISGGPYHRRLLSIAGSAWALAAIEVFLICFPLSRMSDVWDLTGVQAGVSGSASLFGMFFESWLGGWAADSHGRVATFI